MNTVLDGSKLHTSKPPAPRHACSMALLHSMRPCLMATTAAPGRRTLLLPLLPATKHCQPATLLLPATLPHQPHQPGMLPLQQRTRRRAARGLCTPSLHWTRMLARHPSARFHLRSRWQPVQRLALRMQCQCPRSSSSSPAGTRLRQSHQAGTRRSRAVPRQQRPRPRGLRLRWSSARLLRQGMSTGTG